MSESIGRRGLLRSLLGRPAEAAAPPSEGEGEPTRAAPFSLADFYARRSEEAAQPLPRIELRAGLPIVPTTRVGLCPQAEELDLEALVRADLERAGEPRS